MTPKPQPQEKPAIVVGDWVRTKWDPKPLLVVATDKESPFPIGTLGENGLTYVWRTSELIKVKP